MTIIPALMAPPLGLLLQARPATNTNPFLTTSVHLWLKLTEVLHVTSTTFATQTSLTKELAPWKLAARTVSR